MNKAVDVILYTDWMTEDITENKDDMVLKEVYNIKKRVVLSLTMNEWEFYVWLKGIEKELWVRKKTLEIIQH